ncbi:MAG: PAP2 superfamily protein [Parcubacteria group bacterium GW2011_GWF2_39_8b]|nr:MAG: PAP2 superfamily protein [Parcubacteria group bacterium GW2011_GWF2_39_8b]KKR45593.1 MAG: PAP2 superfamily protein [Parcubacteria group bacterium GW2011_GWA2_40_14]
MLPFYYMLDFLAIISAEYLFLVPLFVGGLYFFLQSRPEQKKMIILSAIALSISILSMFILQFIYYNSRPSLVIDFKPLVSHIFKNGFPSTHATMTALIASVIYVFNRKIGLFLFFISILISLSRVYLGLHHFVDIIAGILLAIIMTIIGKTIMNKY